jgi:hypothetical protein
MGAHRAEHSQRQLWLPSQQREDTGLLHEQDLRWFQRSGIGRITFVCGQCSFRKGFTGAKYVNVNIGTNL